MSTDMAINPWTIRASHAPLEVHASHFSTLRTSVNPTLDGPNPPPSTGWSQLSVISSFHHQKFQTKPGHMIIYRIRALLQKKNTIWDTWSEWNHQRWVTNDWSQYVAGQHHLSPVSFQEQKRNLGVPASAWNSLPSRGLENLRRQFGGGVGKEVSETKKYLGVQSYDKFTSRHQLKVLHAPLGNFFCLRVSNVSSLHTFRTKTTKSCDHCALHLTSGRNTVALHSAAYLQRPWNPTKNAIQKNHGWNPHTDGVTWTLFCFPIQENKRVIFFHHTIPSNCKQIGPMVFTKSHL